MGIFTRDSIHQDFKLTVASMVQSFEPYAKRGDLISKKETYDRDAMVSLVRKCHSLFDELGLGKNDYISVQAQLVPEHIALFIAAAERGMIFQSIPTRGLLFSVDENIAKDSRVIKEGQKYVLFQDEHEISAWDVLTVKIPIIKNYPESDFAPVGIDPNNKLLSTTTSGSTGKPKELYHTHNSLYAATKAASENFYNSGDKVLLFTSINHVGVVSMQTLSVMIAGCHAITHVGKNNDVVRLILEEKPNKTIVFWGVVQTFFESPYWEEADLSCLEEVITGGSKIKKDFVYLLLDKGVQSIVNVYGLSEALPPLAVHRITANNIEETFLYTHKDGRCTKMGDILPHWNTKLSNLQELMVKGPALASGSYMEGALTSDGYFPTKDNVAVIDGQYWYKHRMIKSVRRNEVLIDLSCYDYIMSTYSDGRYSGLECRVFEIEDRIILAIILPDDDNGESLSLENINQYIRGFVGHNYCVDDIKIVKKSWPVEDIKERIVGKK